MTKTALILAGHGSHISPHTAGLVWSYVDTLRARGIADEITACFWKEQPAFSQVLDTVTADQIVVVPVFTAQGYFANTVIPAEMGLTGTVTQRDGRTITYTATLGEHPELKNIMQQRIQALMDAENLDPLTVAVAVIGHGTPRSRSSRDAAAEQAQQLRDSEIVAEVVAVYLDDDPAIDTIYHTTTAPNIIAVPYFLAPGSHVTIDVPNALGLPSDAAQAKLYFTNESNSHNAKIEGSESPVKQERNRNNYGDYYTKGQVINNPKSSYIHSRQVFYVDPIGTDLTMVNIILDLACTSGLPFDSQPADEAWRHISQAGVAVLLDTVRSQGEYRFGQLRFTLDAVRSEDASAEAVVIDSLPKLRQYIRENPFRPLTTSDDLPGGWVFPLPSPEMLPAVVETVYPGALANWAAQQNGTFKAETLADVIQWQTGMFKRVQSLTQDTVAAMVKSTCGRCICHPAWYETKIPIDRVPCKSPCNWWLSSALKGT